MSKLEGGCLCGQIRYDCTFEPTLTAQPWCRLEGGWPKNPRNPPLA